MTPNDPDPPAVFQDESGAPIPIDGSLYRYDHPTMGYRTYLAADPAPFGSATVTDGYWLCLTAPTTISYPGQAPGPVQFDLPTAGWYLIGCPDGDHPLTDLEVTDLDASRTVSLHDAIYGQEWIGSRLYWYDPAGGRYAICGFDPWCDTDTLEAWRGYWVYADRGGLRLSMP
jgi:hypothetical protein